MQEGPVSRILGELLVESQEPILEFSKEVTDSPEKLS